MKVQKKSAIEGASASPDDSESNTVQTAGAGEQSGRCDICGEPMIQRNCKLICVNCGFRRDCSDP